jgi:hypothetical protein
MQTNLKKKISLISFQRILMVNPYIFCFSNLSLTKTSLKKKFVSNYVFKTLYSNAFPVNFLNNSSINFKVQNIANNFLNFSKFTTSKNLLLHFNTVEASDRFKILFIKYNNLYFTKDYKLFFNYLNVYLFLSQLKLLLLKHLFVLNCFIKKSITESN